MKEETQGLLAGLSILGMWASVLVYSQIDTYLHSRSERIETSRGTAVVTNWNNEDRRGIQVHTGGIPSIRTYTDINRDGTLANIAHMFGTPRRGVYVDHPSITSQDQKFYEEDISKTSTNIFLTKPF